MGEAKLTRVPSIGRIVHFQATADGGKAPAIVVKVQTPSTVNLRVFSDDDHPVKYVTSVSQGTGPHSWNWPEQL
jgi:hypothetical protein